jgi:hypothetical protein
MSFVKSSSDILAHTEQQPNFCLPKYIPGTYIVVAFLSMEFTMKITEIFTETSEGYLTRHAAQTR